MRGQRYVKGIKYGNSSPYTPLCGAQGELLPRMINITITINAKFNRFGLIITLMIFGY